MRKIWPNHTWSEAPKNDKVKLQNIKKYPNMTKIRRAHPQEVLQIVSISRGALITGQDQGKHSH